MAPIQITLEEPSVKESIAILEEQGFTMDLLLVSSDRDIDSLAPQLLTTLQAYKLKIALQNRKMDEHRQSLYHSLLQFVGRVVVDFEDGSSQMGNAVLIGEEGFALTALHILNRDYYQVESSKGKGKRKMNQAREIHVCFPNTREGPLQYEAQVVHDSIEDDLALLKAKSSLPAQFAMIRKLKSWPRYFPREGDKVMLLSFPAGKGEEAPISNRPSSNTDYPWLAEGTVTCVDGTRSQGFADYSSFGGASGALVVHPLSHDESYITALHLGTYHETLELPTWNKSQLDRLNEGLCQKGFNGYFSLNVGSFIDSYFQPSRAGKVPKEFLHHQVVRVKKSLKEQKDEAIEVVDIFGPWPGLDDADE